MYYWIYESKYEAFTKKLQFEKGTQLTLQSHKVIHHM